MVTNKSYAYSLLGIIVIIRLLVTYVPLVNYHCPESIKLITIVGLYALLLFIDRSFFRNTISLLPLFLIELYSFTLQYLYPVEHDSLLPALYSFIRPLSWALLGLFWLKNANEKDARKLLLWTMLFYIVTAITTCIGCVVFPNAARLMATGMADDPVTYAVYMNYNIGGFSFVYSLTLLTPLVICAIRENLLNRLVCIGILLLILTTILYTEYTTALLFYILSMALFFIPKSISFRRLIVLFLLAILILLVLRPLLGEIMYALSNNIESEQISIRLRELGDAIAGVVNSNRTDLEARTERWDASWDAFLSNPTVGNGIKGGGGGHSFVLDNMARYGILGLLSEIVVFLSLYNKFVCLGKASKFFVYFFFCFLIQIGFAIVNPFVFYEIFTFILPLFYLGFGYKVSRHENTVDYKPATP